MSFPTSICAVVAIVAALPISAQIPDVQTNERAIFLSGDVVLEGGSAPGDPVRVQRVCKGSVEAETWTDTKGRFSFKVQVGGSDVATADAAQPPARDPELSRPIGISTYYLNPVTTALRDCTVQAILAGFWSDRVNISVKNTLDDTHIGTIILHAAIHAGQAQTISATTLEAPVKARRAFEKGVTASREQKWDAAAAELAKAVELYPRFAAAWFELGVVRDRQQNLAAAADAWKQAMQSDPKYVKPYQGLVALAERQQNWTDLEKYSQRWIDLAPEDSPLAYLYNAFANAQLHRFQQAESAARKGLSLDKEQRLPRLRYVLGLLLIEKRDYTGAAECLRSYLELAPNAKDAGMVREELTRIGRMASAPLR